MTGYRQRLTRLERRLAAPARGDCPACGGPRPGQDVYMVVDDRGRPVFGRCKSCGLALNRHGKALAAWPLKPGERPMGVKLYSPETPLEAV